MCKNIREGNYSSVPMMNSVTIVNFSLRYLSINVYYNALIQLQHDCYIILRLDKS